MSDGSNQQQVSNKVVEVLVKSIFKKNGVKPEEMKTNISDEQKEMIKEMVDDLKLQVDQFNEDNKKKNTD